MSCETELVTLQSETVLTGLSAIGNLVAKRLSGGPGATQELTGIIQDIIPGETGQEWDTIIGRFEQLFERHPSLRFYFEAHFNGDFECVMRRANEG